MSFLLSFPMSMLGQHFLHVFQYGNFEDVHLRVISARSHQHLLLHVVLHRMSANHISMSNIVTGTRSRRPTNTFAPLFAAHGPSLRSGASSAISNSIPSRSRGDLSMTTISDSLSSGLDGYDFLSSQPLCDISPSDNEAHAVHPTAEPAVQSHMANSPILPHTPAPSRSLRGDSARRGNSRVEGPPPQVHRESPLLRRRSSSDAYVGNIVERGRTRRPTSSYRRVSK